MAYNLLFRAVMRIATLLIIGITSSLWVSPVQAQAPVCVTGGPGSEDCEERAIPDPETAPMASLGESTNGYERGTRHHDFFLPNGNVTKKGEVSVAIYELGLLNTLAYGLTDRVELSVSAPVYPIFASLGVRVQVAPLKSPWRATVEAHGWVPFEKSDGGSYEFWAQVAGTVAYHGENFNVHATLTGAIHSEDGFELPAGNIGVNLRVRRNLAIHANYASLNTTGTERCQRCINPRLNFAIVGIKYMGQTWDTDFGFAFCWDPDKVDEDFTPPLPLLSFQRNY